MSGYEISQTRRSDQIKMNKFKKYINSHTAKHIFAIVTGIIEIILVFTAILLDSSVFYIGCMPDGKKYFQTILIICCVSLALIYGILNKKEISFKTSLLPLVVVLLTGLIQAICFPDNIKAMMEKIYFPILLLLIMMMVINSQQLERMISIYIFIMTGIAILSLFFYFFCTVFQIIPMQNTSYWWDVPRKARTFLGFYYDSSTWQPIHFLRIDGTRNMAIFTEAPMYAFRLVLALLLNHLYNILPQKFNWIIFITIITTFSITSVMALFVFYMSRFFFLYRKKLLNTKFKKICLLFILIGCMVFFIRLLSQKMGQSSAITRMDHMRACLLTIRHTFPLGCGTNNYSFITKYEIYKQGMSVGLPAFVAMDGIFAVILSILPAVLYTVSVIIKKHTANIAFVCTFMIMIFMTALTYNYIVWFVVVMIFVRDSLICTNRHIPTKSQMRPAS